MVGVENQCGVVVKSTRESAHFLVDIISLLLSLSLINDHQMGQFAYDCWRERAERD